MSQGSLEVAVQREIAQVALAASIAQRVGMTKNGVYARLRKIRLANIPRPAGPQAGHGRQPKHLPATRSSQRLQGESLGVPHQSSGLPPLRPTDAPPQGSAANASLVSRYQSSDFLGWRQRAFIASLAAQWVSSPAIRVCLR